MLGSSYLGDFARGERVRKFLASSVLMAVIFLPMTAQAGPGGHVGGHGFGGHHGFRGGHRFLRQPFFVWGTGGDWMGPVDPVEVVVIPQFVAAEPIAEPPAEPKFVFPPTPSSPSPAGSHTVIVQRGSQIEVQSFPAAR
jgi:hypothetical protein